MGLVNINIGRNSRPWHRLQRGEVVEHGLDGHLPRRKVRDRGPVGDPSTQCLDARVPLALPCGRHPRPAAPRVPRPRRADGTARRLGRSSAVQNGTCSACSPRPRPRPACTWNTSRRPWAGRLPGQNNKVLTRPLLIAPLEFVPRLTTRLTIVGSLCQYTPDTSLVQAQVLGDRILPWERSIPFVVRVRQTV